MLQTESFDRNLRNIIVKLPVTNLTYHESQIKQACDKQLSYSIYILSCRYGVYTNSGHITVRSLPSSNNSLKVLTETIYPSHKTQKVLDTRFLLSDEEIDLDTNYYSDNKNFLIAHSNNQFQNIKWGGGSDDSLGVYSQIGASPDMVSNIIHDVMLDAAIANGHSFAPIVSKAIQSIGRKKFYSEKVKFAKDKGLGNLLEGTPSYISFASLARYQQGFDDKDLLVENTLRIWTEFAFTILSNFILDIDASKKWVQDIPLLGGQLSSKVISSKLDKFIAHQPTGSTKNKMIHNLIMLYIPSSNLSERQEQLVNKLFGVVPRKGDIHFYKKEHLSCFIPEIKELTGRHIIGNKVSISNFIVRY